MEWNSPMEPVSTNSLITGEEWIHEVKWDGIRGIIHIENNSFKLFTKGGRERTAYYPELDEITGLVDAKNAILDGEIVVFDKDNKPSFHDVLTRGRVRSLSNLPYYINHYPIYYIIFDILYIDDKDIRSYKLTDRKEILRTTVRSTSRITITDEYSDGEALFQLMKKKGWEGIVTKRKDSVYLGGKNHSLWFKLKNTKKLLAVVCGIVYKNDMPGSLILGLYKDNSFTYIGRASLGLTQQDFNSLLTYSSELKTHEGPFSTPDHTNTERITWVKPLLTCWVKFLEWTNDGLLRHPIILGFSGEPFKKADGREWPVYD